MAGSIVGLLLVAYALTPGWRPDNGDKYLSRVSSQAEFDRIARVNEIPYKLPHVLFLIDRKQQNRVYYIDSKRKWHHREFASSQYLTLENDTQFVKNNYFNPNRRFVMGWVSYYTPVKKWAYEFWEGDHITAPLIRLADEALNRTFFTRLAFKPNSLDQETNSGTLASRLMPAELTYAIPYQPFNRGRSVGRLRLLPRYDQSVILHPRDIVVLGETPIGLPPVAGIVTAQPGTALSHLNILARTWGVPSVYVRNAFNVLKPLDGKWVLLDAKTGNYSVREASTQEVRLAERDAATSGRLASPRFDLGTQDFAELVEQNRDMVVAYGAKSANLGHVIRSSVPGVTVPSGFTVPFYWYDYFIKENNLSPLVEAIATDPRMKTDRVYAKARLAALRSRIANGDLDPHFKNALLDRVHRGYRSKGLFVRSSTNSEDLPNFSGAGLYTTVPNVKGDDAIVDAIRKVWASVWNDEAFFAREQAGIDHLKVYMAVLLQEAINADSAGVMITTNPFDPEDREAIFVSAKRGLGIKVVEGKKVPEQLVYRRRTNAIQVLTRSGEDSLLTFDQNGGIREVPISGERAVLTDGMVRRLASAANALKRKFGGVEQDIEWAFMGGKVYILQARPYKA
jgi:rifampicin phosphotransferase